MEDENSMINDGSGDLDISFLMSQFESAGPIPSTPTVPYGNTFSDGESGKPHQYFHLHPFLAFLLYTPKGLTVILASASFFLVLMLGFVILCCVRCLRKRKVVDSSGGTRRIDSSSGGSAIYTTPSSFVLPPPKLMIGDSISSSRIGADGIGISGKSKIFQHKNVITPDRNIAFVVPTVSLQTQGKGDEAYPSHLKDGSTVTKTFSTAMPPMLETQFFPQFHFDGGVGPQLGFSVAFDCQNQILKVRILGGCHFPDDAAITFGIHVKLYPGRGTKQKTKEYPGPTPVYNQEFCFHVRGNVLQTKVLKFRVIGATPGVIGTKSLLGVVNLAMKDIPIVNHNDVTRDFRTGQMWIELDHPLHVGEGVRLDVSLKWTHDPTPGLLVLKIREAQGLHEVTEAEYTTTYVKVTLQEQGKNIKSKKTRLIRWGSLPNYDDTFVVTVPFELLSQVSFLLTLFARGRLGSKSILGKINIGPVPESQQGNPQSVSGYTSGNEIWQDMMHQPNVEINRWLQLQP